MGFPGFCVVTVLAALLCLAPGLIEGGTSLAQGGTSIEEGGRSLRASSGPSSTIGSDATEEIDVVAVSGTHFEIGRAIGLKFNAQIRSRLANYESFHTKILPFAVSDKGRPIVDRFWRENTEAFPQYIDELKGMAEGCGIGVFQLFVLNIRSELSALINDEVVREEIACSDQYLITDGIKVLGHNEDGDETSAGISFLVTARVTPPDATGHAYSFTAFCYPGELPTVAFGWNSYGVAFSLNALNPKNVFEGGIGRNFVSRHLLGARSMADALKIVGAGPQATGHNYNIVDTASGIPRVLNVETAPVVDGSGHHVKTVTKEMQGTFFHANLYIRMHLEEFPSASSSHRMARAAAMPAPRTLADVLDVLGDTDDSAYPIYRRATAPDTGYTLCTALFDLNRCEVRVYTSNPKKTPEAYFALPLWRCQHTE